MGQHQGCRCTGSDPAWAERTEMERRRGQEGTGEDMEEGGEKKRRGSRCGGTADHDQFTRGIGMCMSMVM